jgi:hypothetical protein
VRLAPLGPVGALLLAGCATAPSALDWQTDLDAAIARAGREGKPIYALSLFGDLSKKC